MKVFYVLFFLLCNLFVSAYGQEFVWQWAKLEYDNGVQTVNDVVIDSARGFVYAVGVFEGSLSPDFINGTAVNAKGRKDGFIAQFDFNGNCLWSTKIGSSKNDEIKAVDIDTVSGDIYVTGYCNNEGGWGNKVKFYSVGSLPWIGTRGGANYDKEDIFVAKYNNQGDNQWATIDGGNESDIAEDVTVVHNVNGAAEIVITGSFKKRIEVGGNNYGSFTDSKRRVFVIARDASGFLQWKAFSDINNGAGSAQEGVAITNDGAYVYVTGNYMGNIRINSDLSTGGTGITNNLSNPSATDPSIFYTKFTASSGNPWWIESIGSVGNDFAGDIVCHNSKLYIGGGVGDGFTFSINNASYTGINGVELFVSEHNLSGGYINHFTEPNANANTMAIVNKIDFTSDNYMVIGGKFSGTIRFNNLATNDISTTNSNTDGFVSFYNMNFSFREKHHLFGVGNNIVRGIASLGRDVYVGGRYGDVANLDTDITLTNQGSVSGFLSFLEHQCLTDIEYDSVRYCDENSIISPSTLFPTTGGTISVIESGLNINLSNGDITPFSSTAGIYHIVYDDLNACLDTFEIEVVQGLAPVIANCPTDAMVYAPPTSCGKNYLYTPPFSGTSSSCGNETMVQLETLTSGDVFPVGTTSQTYVLSDGYRPNDTCQFFITVVDNTPPTFDNCPTTDIVVYSDANNCDKIVNHTPITATDACGGVTVLQTQGLNFGSIFPLDTTAMIYTANDGNGNSSTCSFDVIVVDTVSPTFDNCPTDTAVFYVSDANLNSCTGLVTFNAPTASDNCGSRVFQSYGVTSGNYQIPSNFYYLEFTAIDSSSNTATCRINYKVVDTIMPTITCPNDTTVYADNQTCVAQVTYADINVGDNCNLFTSSAVQTDASGYSSDSLFPLGTTIQSYQIQDVYGNTSTCSFNVTVIDTVKAYINNDIPTGVCDDADSINLMNFVSATPIGVWSGNGVSNSAYFDPSAVSLPYSDLMYIVGNNACADTALYTIRLHNFTATITTSTDTVCQTSYSLQATPVSGANTEWVAQNNVVYTPSATLPNVTAHIGSQGWHSFVWEVSQDQCVKTDTVDILFFLPPIADAGDNRTVEESETYLDAQLYVGTGVWSAISSNGIIDDTTSSNSLVTNLDLGLNIFRWTVSNGNCPVATDSVRIFYEFLRVPNAFSPNGDGVNDVFEIVGFDLFSDAELMVLDRWGEQIFLSSSSQPYWDGTYQGKTMVEDTYFYILRINNKEYTGYIELRR